MSKYLVFVALLAVLAAAAQAQPTTVTLTSPTSATLTLAADRVAQYGDLNPETFNPDPRAKEALGSRVGFAVKREELPGGPWASGEIGDYLLENASTRVIVKSANRPGVTSMPGAGAIADVVLRDQMWDSLGGITLFVRVNGEMLPILYGGFEIQEPRDPIKTPFLVVLGTVESKPELRIVSTLFLEADQPRLNVSTICLNTGTKPYEVDLVEETQWGTLPVFVPAFGIPKSGPAMKFGARWISGILDDFCLSEVLNSAGPLDVEYVDSNRNMSRHRLASHKLGANEMLRAERVFLLARGDMASVSEFELKTKSQPFGYIEGAMTQHSDKQPIANAEVQIRMFNDRYSNAAGDYAYPPYAITRTDAAGRYKIAVPAGPNSSFAIQGQTPGRMLVPIQQSATLVETAGKIVNFDIPHIDQRLYSFRVVDADTSEALPAKVSFHPTKSDRPILIGAPWQAQGPRNAFYLRPGDNQIPLPGGKIKCVFSRGPEYSVVEKEILFDPDKPAPVQIGLKHLVATPGMVSVDLNLPTKASPGSRVSAADLVLAAAGEGVEWVFSGDLNQATDLDRAIAEMKLEKWVKASAGVHFSFQYPKLFGEFYVFPVPKTVAAADLKKLASERATPAEFFQAVRAAFPGAIISVMQPLRMNAGYPMYYNMDMQTGKSPFARDFSLDFDAVEVFEGKSAQINRMSWDMTIQLLRQGQPKLPLASSRSSNLYFQEPGYPRTYLVAGKDDARAIPDAEAAAALRKGKYFITNGPILQQAVLTDPQICKVVSEAARSGIEMEYRIDNGVVSIAGMDLKTNSISALWPERRLALPRGEFVHLAKLTAAPWVETNTLLFFESGRPIRQSLSATAKNLVRFPAADKAGRTPYLWSLHNPSDDDKSKEIYRDEFMNVEASGATPLRPVVTKAPHGGYTALLVTPPVLLDGDNDGQIRIK